MDTFFKTFPYKLFYFLPSKGFDCPCRTYSVLVTASSALDVVP